MKNIIRISLLINLCTMVSFAQSIRPIEEKDFITEDRVGKFYLIPEAGLWFGNYTNVEIAPQIAYHITDRISLGAGPHYIFYQNNDYYSPINFSSHIFGFKAFSRLSVIRDASEILPIYLFDELFAHVEFETMTMENKYFNAPTFPDEGRFWNDYLYIGAGISQKYSQRSSYFVLLLWNLNDSFNSLYQNPTYRVGISVNLK